MSLTIIPPSDPRLWTPAIPVTDIAAQVTPFVDEMKGLMDAHHGVGLAANQCALPHAFYIWYGPHDFEVVINPVIVESKGSRISALEGCLSFPGREAYVPRYQILRVRYLSLDGQERDEVVSLWFARIAAHEIDHLLGRCILPRP